MLLITPDTPESLFPAADSASSEGLVAVGGKLTTERLLSAYRNGIFPWYSDDQPVLWWSPEPRAVLFPEQIRITRSLAKTLRNRGFEISADRAYGDVIDACAGPRGDSVGGGTWITADMKQAYTRLHELGYGHSIEVWLDGELAGGLYGLALGNAFFGESMFSWTRDASKVAMVWLARHCRSLGVEFIDCQLPTAHLARMGAVELTRRRYLRLLQQALRSDDRIGRWTLAAQD